MNSSIIIPISYADLIVASLLIVVSGAVSLALHLHLEKQLFVAAVRTVVQLLLVGYILRIVFSLNHPAALAVVIIFMILAATQAAVGRPSRRFKGMVFTALLAISLTGLVVAFTVTEIVIGVEPWFNPRYVIPLMGMVLGNALTALSLCYDHLLESLIERRDVVEMELAHGATRWEAVREPISAAVRHSLIPAVNAMMVVGIVSLPGMMTGQILAGADPIDAVKYQIVVMFMITAAAAMAAIIGALLAYLRLFNERHQLCSELINFNTAK